MRKELVWQAARTLHKDEKPSEFFPAAVPGAAQLDYARFKGFKDYRFADNYKQFDGLEDSFWTYKAALPAGEAGKRTVFYCGGIDYEYEIYAGGERIYCYEGMFTPVRLDLTGLIARGVREIEIKIFPSPKRKGAPVGRWEADNSAKPPVSYGWDWQPRLISQGIWKETYIEYLPDAYIKDFDISYELSDDFSSADILLDIDLPAPQKYTVRLLDTEGKTAARAAGDGKECRLTLKKPRLWWPVRHGVQYRYTLEIETESGHKATKKVGFRRSRLVTQDMNWWIDKFPFTQALPPITLEINGRQIFGKGSNFVNPEIFVGTITRETYEPLIRIAAESNMNIFRVWGGAIVNKDDFFDLCDEYGMMVWQEFPLACNCYKDEPRYLSVMEREAVSIIKAVKPHPCHVLWCGGNELYTGGSSMTEQFLVLRLLNSLCFSLDKYTPFLYTSPVMGMRHGHYIFRFSDGGDCFKAFQDTLATAFTEFGCPAPSGYDYIKEFIPADELSLEAMAGGKSWEAHHGVKAWEESSWMCRPIVESFFGVTKDLHQLIERGQILSRNGYKAMFEEARRQKPNCHMAINWCYNEPWPCAANNSLLNYPAVKRDNLSHVAQSLKDLTLSARTPKFSYIAGEVFTAEMFVLNDTLSAYKNIDIKAYLEFGKERILIHEQIIDAVEPDRNAVGGMAKKLLSDRAESSLFKLLLVSEKHPEANNSYEFMYYNRETAQKMEKKRIVMDFVGIRRGSGDYTGVEIF